MLLEIEVGAKGRREWVESEPTPHTPHTCPTWVELFSPSASPHLLIPSPHHLHENNGDIIHLHADITSATAPKPTWFEPPSPRLAPPPPLSTTQRPPACILAMGRATPPHRIDQSTYTDWYFNITSSTHKTELKQKMQRICDRSGIKTRYSILTDEFLKAHPEFYTPGQPSIEERNAIFAEEVPKLAHQAAMAAIKEWGRPACDITHLVVATLTGVAIPGADVMLTKSLGLRPDVNRVMLYMLGCYAGLTALRVAKDLAENNPESRILICCSELSAPTFRAPNEDFPYDLVGTALFGDAASGVIVGAQPLKLQVERPLYEIKWVGEILAPDSEKIIEGRLKLEGLQFYLDKTLPSVVSKNVGHFCTTALDHAPGNPGFNDVFWAIHSGGPAILRAVEEALQLHQEKLDASRHILENYGNVSASTVLFVLDELRKEMGDDDNDGVRKQRTCDWGLALAFGPGVTIEGTLLKRCIPQ